MMSLLVGEHVAITCKLPFLRKVLRLHALKLACSFGLFVHQCVLPALCFFKAGMDKDKMLLRRLI